MKPKKSQLEPSTRLELLISPNAKKSKIVGPHGDRLKIALAAPPVDGKANEELIRFLAEEFNLKQNQIEIVKGQTSRQKSVLIKAKLEGFPPPHTL